MPEEAKLTNPLPNAIPIGDEEKKIDLKNLEDLTLIDKIVRIKGKNNPQINLNNNDLNVLQKFLDKIFSPQLDNELDKGKKITGPWDSSKLFYNTEFRSTVDKKPHIRSFFTKDGHIVVKVSSEFWNQYNNAEPGQKHEIEEKLKEICRNRAVEKDDGFVTKSINSITKFPAAVTGFGLKAVKGFISAPMELPKMAVSPFAKKPSTTDKISNYNFDQTKTTFFPFDVRESLSKAENRLYTLKEKKDRIVNRIYTKIISDYDKKNKEKNKGKNKGENKEENKEEIGSLSKESDLKKLISENSELVKGFNSQIKVLEEKLYDIRQKNDDRLLDLCVEDLLKNPKILVEEKCDLLNSLTPKQMKKLEDSLTPKQMKKLEPLLTAEQKQGVEDLSAQRDANKVAGPTEKELKNNVLNLNDYLKDGIKDASAISDKDITNEINKKNNVGAKNEINKENNVDGKSIADIIGKKVEENIRERDENVEKGVQKIIKGFKGLSNQNPNQNSSQNFSLPNNQGQNSERGI